MTPDELIAGATKLRPILERNADRADRDRRLPEETVNAMHEAGIFRILAPRRFGGCEADLGTLMDVVGQISQGCCSAGWLTLLMQSCTWLAALYPEQAQEEVFASGPDVRAAAVLAPTGTALPQAGGTVVNGRWSYMSGILHAQWALVGVRLPHIDPQAFGLALIPMHEMRIEDTWYTAGMRGTGSNTAVADDVFLPAHRMFPFSEAMRTHRYPTPHTGALYRHPLAPTLATMLTMVYPGMAQAALDYVRDHATARGIGYSSYGKQSTSVAFQLCIAEAATKTDTAWLYARRAPRTLTQATEAQHTFTPVERAMFRRDLGHVAALCRDAVNTLVQAYGAGAFAETCPLQRIWRDCAVASTHAVANPLINQETLGRALLGEPPITPLM